MQNEEGGSLLFMLHDPWIKKRMKHWEGGRYSPDNVDLKNVALPVRMEETQ